MGGDPGGWGRRGDKGGELLAASWLSHPVGGADGGLHSLCRVRLYPRWARKPDHLSRQLSLLSSRPHLDSGSASSSDFPCNWAVRHALSPAAE